MKKFFDCKHCGKPATTLVSRPSPFSPQYPLCADCADDENTCIYYAHEQHKYKTLEQFGRDNGRDMTRATATLEAANQHRAAGGSSPDARDRK